MEIDIRQEENKVKTIRFAGDSSVGGYSGATYIRRDRENDICMSGSYVTPNNLENLIKALKKANELGWGI